jgi:hypothetical protein
LNERHEQKKTFSFTVNEGRRPETILKWAVAPLNESTEIEFGQLEV